MNLKPYGMIFVMTSKDTSWIHRAQDMVLAVAGLQRCGCVVLSSLLAVLRGANFASSAEATEKGDMRRDGDVSASAGKHRIGQVQARRDCGEAS